MVLRVENTINSFKFTHIKNDGMYFLAEGSIILEAFNNLCNYNFKKYDFFGENLLFNCLSLTKFGRIIAG